MKYHETPYKAETTDCAWGSAFPAYRSAKSYDWLIFKNVICVAQWASRTQCSYLFGWRDDRRGNEGLVCAILNTYTQ